MSQSQRYKYVDIDEALKLIGGYEEIYRKLVRAFLENQKELIAYIDERLSNDLKEVRRAVHSVKGISQNLGAMRLYDVAHQLEKAIVDEVGMDVITIYYDEFKAVFLGTFEELKAIDSE